MTEEEILDVLAPCGLNCKKCMGFVEGDIKNHSERLKKLLGNFDIYAERFSKFMPVFRNYPQFKELLEFFISGDCHGCRHGECKFSVCGVKDCYREKGVDFCFQCEEFPCEKTNFDSHLKERWLRMNRRMKEVGVKQYHRETGDDPRYQ